MGILTLVVYLAGFAYTWAGGGRTGSLLNIAHVWQPVGEATRRGLGDNFLLLMFVGLWLGAASHTFTDMAGSFVKTVRVSDFL